jgi:RNA ligase
MGYMHIENLYRNQDILLFRECYAMEKIHGTSAHIGWRENRVFFSSGGASGPVFEALFNKEALVAGFAAIGNSKITIYGEAYGGSEQKQAWRYGKSLKFVAFEVQIDDVWLNVPVAAEIVKGLGLEFVHFVKVSTDLEALNAERDAPSVQAQRNGVEGVQPREGVVLRPLIELTMNDGSRVITKHKRDAERETNKPREVVDPAKLEVLTKANEIAEEWVTPTRLDHVLQKMPQGIGMEKTKEVIAAMVEDVLREAKGEIVDSKEARVAISKRTAELFKTRLKAGFVEGNGEI